MNLKREMKNASAGLERTEFPSILSSVGRGAAHHGEILQGAFFREDGTLDIGVVSLPFPLRHSTARFRPAAGSLFVKPNWKRKSRRAAELTLATILPGERIGGELLVASNLPEGIGLGSSTADVAATIRAVASALGERLDALEVARIAVKAEGAVDGVIIGDDLTLFASRTGEVMESLGRFPPGFSVLGFDTEDMRVKIETIETGIPSYEAKELEELARLRSLLRSSVRAGDCVKIGAVATGSAMISQCYSPKRNFGKIMKIAEDTGAVGVQVAHTGTVAGLLFISWDENTQDRIQMAQCMIRKQLGIVNTWTF